MKRSLIIAENDGIAVLLENDKVCEFFVNRGELLLGDVYTAIVENILPAIDAAFVNLGKDKMGFLHANDVNGQGSLRDRLLPKQKLLVQITKEPTGHKGPRVSTSISLPGKFLVLVPEEQGISVSRRISDVRERLRLKSIINLMKPPGIGVIIRTEAKGHSEKELFDDFEMLFDRWQSIVTHAEATIGPTLIYRDQDLMYRVIRDTYSQDMGEIILDSQDATNRACEYLQGWANKNTKVICHDSDTNLLVSKNIHKEIELALNDRVSLPSGGYLNIQPTEALTVIDVNSGKFTSSRTQALTVKKTNLEAATEISRQLRLRNIGGMVIVDFIDMESRKDQQQVLEVFQKALEDDRAKPQLGQLTDLGLVELTRHRQGQSLRELFTKHCSSCNGLGITPNLILAHNGQKSQIELSLASNALVSNLINNSTKNNFLKAASLHGRKIVPVVSSTKTSFNQDEDISADIDESNQDVTEDLVEREVDDIKQDELSQIEFGVIQDEGSQLDVTKDAVLVDDFVQETSLFEDFLLKPNKKPQTLNLKQSQIINENSEENLDNFAEIYADEVDLGDLQSFEIEKASDSYAKELNSVDNMLENPSSSMFQNAQSQQAGLEAVLDPNTGIYQLKIKQDSELDEIN